MFEKSILFSSLGFAALLLPSTETLSETSADEASAELTPLSATQDSRPVGEKDKPAPEAEKKQRELPSTDPAKDEAIGTIQRFIDEQVKNGKIDKEKANWKTSLPMPPKVETFDAKKDYFWNIRTNKGDIQIKLMPDVAPMHISSTMYLVRLGFYDGLTFHRVIKGFMAQGGCPLGKGHGSPGYRYKREISKNVRHAKRGTLSMANSGAGSEGSQFFLTFKPLPQLDGGYTVYGEIVDGLLALDKLEAAGAPRDPGTPTEPLFMISSTISTKAKPVEGEKKAEGQPSDGK